MFFAHKLFVSVFVNFSLLQTQDVPHNLSEKYSQKTSVFEEFRKGFADFKSKKEEFCLLGSPRSFSIEKAPNKVQVELIDL